MLKRKLLQNILLLIITLILILVVLEIGLRVFYPYVFQKNAWRSADLIDHEHIPNKIGRWKSPEFDNYFQTNSEGWVDTEYNWFNKSNNAHRILILGDSFAEAIQVPLEKSFHFLLEEKLNENQGKNYEIINMGVSDYSTLQEYLILKEKGLQYNPDQIILIFYEGNDYYDNLRSIKKRTPTKDFLRMHFYSYCLFKDFKNRIFVQKKSLRKQVINQTSLDVTQKYLTKINDLLKSRELNNFIIVSILSKDQKEGHLNKICEHGKLYCIFSNLDKEDYFLQDYHLNIKGHEKLAAQLYNTNKFS